MYIGTRDHGPKVTGPCSRSCLQEASGPCDSEVTQGVPSRVAAWLPRNPWRSRFLWKTMNIRTTVAESRPGDYLANY